MGPPCSTYPLLQSLFSPLRVIKTRFRERRRKEEREATFSLPFFFHSISFFCVGTGGYVLRRTLTLSWGMGFSPLYLFVGIEYYKKIHFPPFLTKFVSTFIFASFPRCFYGSRWQSKRFSTLPLIAAARRPFQVSAGLRLCFSSSSSSSSSFFAGRGARPQGSPHSLRPPPPPPVCGWAWEGVLQI